MAVVENLKNPSNPISDLRPSFEGSHLSVAEKKKKKKKIERETICASAGVLGNPRSEDPPGISTSPDSPVK